MSELLESTSTTNTDKTKVTIYTRTFQFDDFMHTARVGKEGRRLTQSLNTDKSFIAMTEVQIIDRHSGKQDPGIIPLIHINMASVEYVQPHLDS